MHTHASIDLNKRIDININRTLIPCSLSESTSMSTEP